MGISGLRFSRNTIKGHFIDDAYLYQGYAVFRGGVDRTTAAER
jgi:hypothetical protein